MAKELQDGLALFSFLVHLVAAPNIFAASLPVATEEMLVKLKLDRSIVADVEKELQVPQEWIEKAKKEGKVRIFATSSDTDPTEMSVFLRPFKERYPFISVEVSGASREERAVKTLVAYRSGRIIADILTSVGGTFYKFKEANALEDLRNIPAMKNIPEGAADPGGLWVGRNVGYYCIAYNTKLGKKEEKLPVQWEDLLTNPRWRAGNLAMNNRPNLWLLNLWKTKGENWVKDFVTKLFAEVKPQLRKEGLNATLELLAAGEFHAVVPAQAALTAQKALSGAPIGFVCPEPVPASVDEMIVLKGSPNLHASKILVNWSLSKEGQIAQYVSTSASPVHRGLRRKEFLPFAEQILGKEESYREPGLETEALPKLLQVWNEQWMRGSGQRK